MTNLIYKMYNDKIMNKDFENALIEKDLALTIQMLKNGSAWEGPKKENFHMIVKSILDAKLKNKNNKIVSFCFHIHDKDAIDIISSDEDVKSFYHQIIDYEKEFGELSYLLVSKKDEKYYIHLQYDAHPSKDYALGDIIKSTRKTLTLDEKLIFDIVKSLSNIHWIFV